MKPWKNCHTSWVSSNIFIKLRNWLFADGRHQIITSDGSWGGNPITSRRWPRKLWDQWSHDSCWGERHVLLFRSCWFISVPQTVVSMGAMVEKYLVSFSKELPGYQVRIYIIYPVGISTKLSRSLAWCELHLILGTVFRKLDLVPDNASYVLQCLFHDGFLHLLLQNWKHQPQSVFCSHSSWQAFSCLHWRES